MGIDWGFSGAVVITGLVVVFAILLLLVFLCQIMGYVFTKIDGNKNSKVNEKTDEPTEVKVVEPVKMVKETGINNSVVAAISAAIAVIMGENGSNKPFAIKSIKKSKSQRSAWNAAGISDNTRQF